MISSKFLNPFSLILFPKGKIWLYMSVVPKVMRYKINFFLNFKTELHIPQFPRIGDYRIFVNILRCSRINWWVIARTDFHLRYSPIFSLIFIYSPNLEMPRMYSAHSDEYWECMNALMRTLLVRLFSPNVLSYSQRKNVCAVPALD